MLEELTMLTGTVEERAVQCLKKAGWYEGRKTDISEVESYYSGKGITLTEPQKDIFREFYGLAELWSLKDDEDLKYEGFNEDLNKYGTDFWFCLRPGNHPEFYNFDFADYSDPKCFHYSDVKKLEMIEGGVIYFGYIGYHYPSYCFADCNGRMRHISGGCGRLSCAVYDNMTDLIVDTGEFEYSEWSCVRMRRYI